MTVSRAPALPLSLALIAGIVLPSPASPAWAFTFASFALVGAAACARRRHALGTVLVTSAFAALGSAASSLHERAVENSPLRSVYHRLGGDAFSTPRRLEGTLRRTPETRFDRTVLTVDVDSLVVRRQRVGASGGVRVSVRGERREPLDELAAGDRIQVWAALFEPTSFNNPGSYDGTRLLELQHVDVLGAVKSGLLVRRLERAPSALAWISRARRRVLARLAVALDGRSFAVVAALVTGVRTELDPELVRLYQRAGIFHVMAISGAHVGIWVTFGFALGRRAGLSTRHTLLALIALLPLYALFCGGRAPVVRAVVMALLLIGARLSSLTPPTANALAMAGLALLAWEPGNLADPGFQLTMAAMATIVVFYRRLAERLAGLGFLARPLAVSLAAQIGVVPIAAWHFHRLTLASPVASLVAIPLAAAICVLGATLVVVAGVPVLGATVSALTEFAVATLTGVAAIASALPAASIRVAIPSWIFFVVYAGAACALLAASSRARVAGAATLGVLFVFLLVPRHSSPGVLEVHALDVGHGDAIVVSLPEGENVLIDGGGLARSSLDIGESVVLPFLLHRGVRRLDAVVVTHGDYDHIGGLITVVSELPVGSVWQGRPDVERAAYRVLRERARSRGVRIRTLSAGERFEMGGADFEVLAAGEGESPNNRSLVLRVSYAGRSVLFTGDAEEELERRLVRAGIDLRSDVLKLAHHGSASSTSSAFLEAVRPELAIVSAREHRSRPIPSEVVLERLRRRGIEYARTDVSGTVTVSVHRDGRVELATFGDADASER